MSEIAVFGAGCFWGVEERFRTLSGVNSTEVGYCGGNLPNPSYKEVCTGTTDHAEVVKIDFNPRDITYRELLDIFFRSHNPTTLNRQGPDVGTQYRSVVFYSTEEQKVIAEEVLKEQQESGRFDLPIVTQIVELNNYFAAEEYHQKYLYKKGVTSCGL
ncbi:peptide-methionine (S)-S-oxide reductase MsrA [Bacteriovorax sp. Seq25_V]|uniref:peptide-methionine (S)-S-oxide reductase MsrA n=1 Tax=Bacteriovorax sp. Seq25_V TaxID=1201288 RepID=UPI00038A4896|nr:peptide-methionine (S)-S-oxide reductase MsrA [Bacteriovorax sp. Seq25_V]EQC45519.1 peptide-methionine (S)-S-oxide reductase [Bacteriovorax sp. Seq25_V]